MTYSNILARSNYQNSKEEQLIKSNVLDLKLIGRANFQIISVTPLILYNNIVIVLKDVSDYQYFKAEILNYSIYS
jgi:hypothetical protein